MLISVLSAPDSGVIAPATLSALRLSQPIQTQPLPVSSVIVMLGNGKPVSLVYDASGAWSGLSPYFTPVLDASGKASSIGFYDATGLLHDPAVDGTTGSIAQTLSSMLVAGAELATAGLNGNVTNSGAVIGRGDLQTALAKSTTSTTQALSSLAAADLHLSIAAVGTGMTSATSVEVASALAQIQNLPAQSANLSASILPTAVLSATVTGSPTTVMAAADMNPLVSIQSAPVVGTSQTSTIPTATPTSPVESSASPTTAGLYNASDALQSLLDNPGAQALTTVATDPAYGAAAAELYVSAGIYHSQLMGPQNHAPPVSHSILPVLPTRSLTKLV